MNRSALRLFTIGVVLLQQSLFIDTYYTPNKPVGRHNYSPPRYPDLERVSHRIDADSRHYHSHQAASVASHNHRHWSATTEVAVAAAVAAPTPAPGVHPRVNDEYDEEVDEDEEDDDEEEEEEDDEESEDEVEVAKVARNHAYQPSRLAWHSGSDSASSTTTPVPRVTIKEESSSTMSPYSQQKWNTFGRPKYLEAAYRDINKKSAELEAALHRNRMNQKTTCRVPHPKVINVQELYSHPGKTYLPHCTIIHRCGDDTGCCRTATHSCVPLEERTKRIELYFYTTTQDAYGSHGYRQRGHHTSRVEKLVFYNHTECVCRNEEDEEMPKDMASDHHLRNQFQLASSTPNSYRIPHYQPSSLDVITKNRDITCRCPREFASRPMANSTCSCDCFDKQRDCLRLKKGKEYFTHEDKLCIEKKYCNVPTCEYGGYNQFAGRCPRKPDVYSKTRNRYV